MQRRGPKTRALRNEADSRKLGLRECGARNLYNFARLRGLLGDRRPRRRRRKRLHHDAGFDSAPTSSLVTALAKYEMPATFAFVMALTLRPDEFPDWLPRLTDVQVDGANWMRNFRHAKSIANMEGWCCPEAFELVLDSGKHEIGCHGFRHVPVGNVGLGSEAVSYELRSAGELARRKGIDLKTFVFPRNQIGRLDLLAELGYIGFRNASSVEGRHGRLGNLIREFNVFEASQDPEPPSFDLVSIPGGYFLNWKCGLRKWTPEAVTLARWRSILDDAATTGRVALLYLHPHNLISGPGTLELFCRVLQLASNLRESKGLEILTQAEYCERSVKTGITKTL